MELKQSLCNEGNFTAGLRLLKFVRAYWCTYRAGVRLPHSAAEVTTVNKAEIRMNGFSLPKATLCSPLRLPGIAPFATLNAAKGAKLDALYIPTHRFHSISQSRLKSLSTRCKNIYLLASRHAKQVFADSNQIPSRCEVLDVATDRRFVALFGSLTTTNNPSFEVTRSYDLPLKRNYALRHARRNGHKLIGLLDDDIEMEPLHVAAATKCLRGGATMTGYYVLDFPDVSAIDHVDRKLTGGASSTMVGGNALFIDTQHVSGFFPYTFNEDWMFVFHNLESQQMNPLGAVRQGPGAPWRNSKRIRFEEFGETVIEGFLALKENDASIYSGTPRFWANVVRQRHSYLSELKRGCQSPTFAVALNAARQQSANFSGEMLARFVRALERDMKQFLYENH